MATGQTTKRRRRAATRDHDAELWAHIEPDSSRLLLLSALDAFLARGFHAATTREIAERAGMSPAAVYVHWKAKHDLLFEISRIGHQAVLDVVEQALEQASEDPVERVHAFVSAFARWHAENHALARVIQYEFKKLPRSQFRRIVAHPRSLRGADARRAGRGAAAGVFEVEDLEGTTLAVLSLCIDLARWYEPADDHNSAEAVGELYAGLVIRMLERR